MKLSGIILMLAMTPVMATPIFKCPNAYQDVKQANCTLFSPDARWADVPIGISKSTANEQVHKPVAGEWRYDTRKSSIKGLAYFK